MTKARDLASSGVTLTSTTTTADAALARAGGTMTGNLAMGTNLVDGVDVSARDAVLTDTTTKATAALPKAGGAMTGAITTNSTFDGVDIATRDGILSSTTTTATAALNNANSALSREGGAMTGAITTNSTFDGVDVGARNSVLTSTTTTANAALPKAGGAMTGAITTNSTFDGVDIATRDSVLTTTTNTANAALPKAGGTVTGTVIIGSATSGNAHPNANELIIGGTGTNQRSGMTVVSASNQDGAVMFSDGSSSGNSYISGQLVYNHPDTSFRFYNNAVTETLRLSPTVSYFPTGNVGVGIAAPAQKLHLYSTGQAIALIEGVSAYQTALMLKNNHSSVQSQWHLAAAGGTSGWGNANGNFIIRDDTTNSTGIEIERGAGGASGALYIDSSSNVLAGKATSNGAVVGNEFLASGRHLTTVNNTTCSIINRLGSNDGTIQLFEKAGNAVGEFGVEFSDNLFIRGASGHGGIAFGTNTLYPSAGNGSTRDDEVTLGATNNRFKDLYLSGGVFLGGNGTANKLDDYEKGSFTVGYSGATIGGGSTRGYYIKVGSMVFWTFYSEASNISSASGTAAITGLPFTVYNDVSAYTPINIAHNTYFGGSTTVGTMGYHGPNGTTVVFNNPGVTASSTYVNGNSKYLMVSGTYVTNS